MLEAQWRLRRSLVRLPLLTYQAPTKVFCNQPQKILLFAQLQGPTPQSPKDLLFNSEAYKATYQESLFSSFINNSYPPQRHTSDIYLVTVFIKEDSPAKKPLPEESTEHIYSLELTLKFGHAKHVRIHTVIDIAPSLPERSTAEKALIHKAFLIPNKMR